MDLNERERMHIEWALRCHATGLRKLAAESDPREFDLLISALLADAAESERLAALLAPERKDAPPVEDLHASHDLGAVCDGASDEGSDG